MDSNAPAAEIPKQAAIGKRVKRTGGAGYKHVPAVVVPVAGKARGESQGRTMEDSINAARAQLGKKPIMLRDGKLIKRTLAFPGDLNEDTSLPFVAPVVTTVEPATGVQGESSAGQPLGQASPQAASGMQIPVAQSGPQAILPVSPGTQVPGNPGSSVGAQPIGNPPSMSAAVPESAAEKALRLEAALAAATARITLLEAGRNTYREIVQKCVAPVRGKKPKLTIDPRPAELQAAHYKLQQTRAAHMAADQECKNLQAQMTWTVTNVSKTGLSQMAVADQMVADANVKLQEAQAQAKRDKAEADRKIDAANQKVLAAKAEVAKAEAKEKQAQTGLPTAVKNAAKEAVTEVVLGDFKAAAHEAVKEALQSESLPALIKSLIDAQDKRDTRFRKNLKYNQRLLELSVRAAASGLDDENRDQREEMLHAIGVDMDLDDEGNSSSSSSSSEEEPGELEDPSPPAAIEPPRKPKGRKRIGCGGSAFLRTLVDDEAQEDRRRPTAGDADDEEEDDSPPRQGRNKKKLLKKAATAAAKEAKAEAAAAAREAKAEAAEAAKAAKEAKDRAAREKEKTLKRRERESGSPFIGYDEGPPAKASSGSRGSAGAAAAAVAGSGSKARPPLPTGTATTRVMPAPPLKKKQAQDWEQDPSKWMEPKCEWKEPQSGNFNPAGHKFPFASPALTSAIEAMLKEYAAVDGVDAAAVDYTKLLVRKVLVYFRFRNMVDKSQAWQHVMPSIEVIKILVNNDEFADSVTVWDEPKWWVSGEVRASNEGARGAVTRKRHSPPTSDTSSQSSDSSSESTSQDSRERPPPRPPAMPPLGTIPVTREKDDRNRKRDVDFRKDMANIKSRLHDGAKAAHVDRWESDVTEFAQLHYGPEWMHIDTVALGIVQSFTDDLKDMYRADHKHGSRPLHWAGLLKWVRDHVDREVRDKEQDARQALISGMITQGTGTVHRYHNNFRKALQYIPAMSDLEKIVFFTRGLSASVKPYCTVDVHGKPWTDFNALLDFAVAKEITMQSEARTQSQFSALIRGPRDRAADRKAKAWAKSARNPSLHAQVADQAGDEPATGKAAKAAAVSGSGNRGAPRGRGLGRGDSGRGKGGRGDSSERRRRVIEGQPGEAYHNNPKISNKQAQWLSDNKYCWHCYLPIPACKAAKKGQWCNSSGSSTKLTPGMIPGCPGWK